MPATVFSANKFLDSVFRGISYTAPANLYLALFNGDPQGAGTELTSAGGYARILIPAFSAAASKAISSSGNANFGIASADYSAVVTHLAFFDASSSGNMWYSAVLAVSKTIAHFDEFVELAGQLNFQLAS